jgi:hypothetical protein
MKPTFTAVAIATALLMAAQAFAQSEIAPRASVSVLGGTSSSEDFTGAMLGGSMTFDVNDRVAIEGEAAYLDRGAGVDAMSASGSLLLNLLPAHRRIVPYAAVGGGLYRTSFDLNNGNMFGPVGSQFSPAATVCAAPGSGMGFGPGPGFGPGSGICPGDTAGYIGVGQMPAFYGRRLGPMAVPVQGVWRERAFTDPAATVGGGVRFHLSDRVMVRPDVRARFIFGDGDTYVMAVVAFNVGYRF